MTSGSWTKGTAESIAEALRIRSQLTLVDQALIMRVHVLNRIFNRDDVLVPSCSCS